MMPLSSAGGASRMANRITKQAVYECSLASLHGNPVAASNGLTLSPTIPVDKMGPANIVFVCGGVNVEQAVTS